MVCSSASLWHPGWGQPAGPWGVFEQPSRPQPRLRTSPNPQKKGGQWWDLGQLPGAGGMTHTICDPALGHRPQGACPDPQLKARSTVWGLHVEATGGQASCFWKVGREATSWHNPLLGFVGTPDLQPSQKEVVGILKLWVTCYLRLASKVGGSLV